MSLGLVAAITSAVLIAVLGGGEVADHVELQPGGTWLASTDEIVHVNGAAATADANVTLPDSGDGSGLEVVERGGDVYAVDRDERPPHWFRIRAATQSIEAKGELDTPSSDLQTVTSPQGAYVIDRRGTVHPIAPDGPGRSLRLPRPLGQAAVDATGTIWVPTGAGTIVAIRHGKTDKPIRIGARRARLDAIAIGGRIVILDQTRARLVPLDALGRPGQPITIDGLQGTVRIPETIETGTVLYLVDAGNSTTMIRVDLATRTVTPALPLDAADPGPVQITGPRGYLVDRATGTILQIDIATGTTQPLDIEAPDNFKNPDTELTVRTGIVYVNNPNTDNALVIGHDGQPRHINKRNITPPRPRQDPQPEPPTPTPQPTPAPGSRGGPSAPPPPGAKAPGAPLLIPDPSRPGEATPGDRSVTLNWSLPDNGGSTISNFEVNCTPGCPNWTTAGTAVTFSTPQQLENGATYTFKVRARNQLGFGPFSNALTGAPTGDVPGAPQNVQAIANDDGTVTISWTPHRDKGRGLSGYHVYDTTRTYDAPIPDPAATQTRTQALPSRYGLPTNFVVAALSVDRGNAPIETASAPAGPVYPSAAPEITGVFLTRIADGPRRLRASATADWNGKEGSLTLDTPNGPIPLSGGQTYDFDVAWNSSTTVQASACNEGLVQRCTGPVPSAPLAVSPPTFSLGAITKGPDCTPDPGGVNKVIGGASWQLHANLNLNGLDRRWVTKSARWGYNSTPYGSWASGWEAWRGEPNLVWGGWVAGYGRYFYVEATVSYDGISFSDRALSREPNC